MSKCKLFVPTKSGCREKCTNCKRWTGKRCQVEHLLTPYEETKEFEELDRLMRGNKGIEGPL